MAKQARHGLGYCPGYGVGINNIAFLILTTFFYVITGTVGLPNVQAVLLSVCRGFAHDNWAAGL